MNTPSKSSAAHGEARPILSITGQPSSKLDNLSSFHKNICSILDNLCYSGFVMFSEPYRRALVGLLDAAKSEKNRLLGERLTLEKALEENIAALREIEHQTKHFEDLILLGTDVDTTAGDRPLALEKSFTGAIAFVLKGASHPSSPVEIRDRLEELGFDSSEWKTDVVSSVHTVLKRFLASKPPQVIESGEPRRKVYQWNWDEDARQHLKPAGVGN